MDSRDIFRRFFGFPNRHPSSFGDFDEEIRNNGRDGERFDIFFDDGSRGLEGMFEHFHGDMWRQMESLHRQMEDLFKGFGAVDFPSSSDQPHLRPLDPDGEGMHGSDDKMLFWSSIPNPFFGRSEKRSPRDYMLKDNAEDDIRPRGPALPAPSIVDKRPKLDPGPDRRAASSQSKRDTDLDGKISEDKILEMIKEPTKELLPVGKPLVELLPNHFSSRKSISVMTVTGADNKVEHKRTMKDSSGKEESTVTRSIGDKSYSVTTVTNKDGTQQKHETFTNMDESDVSKFEEQWARKRQPSTGSQLAEAILPQWNLPAIDSQDRNLYSKLFGWKN
jgi:hypothetical protein